MEISVTEAKKNFSRLVRRAQAGEEITITKRGIPIARLIPAQDSGFRRKLGMEAHRLKISDDFDAPLPDEVLAGFLGVERKTKSRKR